MAEWTFTGGEKKMAEMVKINCKSFDYGHASGISFNFGESIYDSVTIFFIGRRHQRGNGRNLKPGSGKAKGRAKRND